MAKKQQHSVDIEKWLKLTRADNVGPTTFAKLTKRFGSPQWALAASVGELAKRDGKRARIFLQILTYSKKTNVL